MPTWTQEAYDDFLKRRAAAGAKLSAEKPQQTVAIVDTDNYSNRMMLKVAVDTLWNKYLEVGSIHKAARFFGICGETARQLILKNGFRLNNSKWNSIEVQTIIEAYQNPNGYDLEPLAVKLGRTHAAVACKADELGLTSERGHHIRTARNNINAIAAKKKYAKEHPEIIAPLQKYMAENPPPFTGKKHSPETVEQISIRNKAWHMNNPHPRGMLGKHHTQETKEKISRQTSGCRVPPERTLRSLQTRVARYGKLTSAYRRGTWKAGWREVGGKRFYARSRWEANYARYLQFLKEHGQLIEWEHEPVTFWFLKIKRGTRSYLPDFRVTFSHGIEYHECKGWMDSRSKTKLARMKKYHPEITMIVRDAKWFRSNRLHLRGLIPGWEDGRC